MENETLTVTELSRYLNISPRQIQMYVSQGVLPKKSKGRYDRNRCVSSYMDHKLIGPGTNLAKLCPFEFDYVRERISYMQGRIAELEAQIGSRTCQVCGAPLQAKRNDARYCSGKCRATAHRGRIRQ